MLLLDQAVSAHDGNVITAVRYSAHLYRYIKNQFEDDIVRICVSSCNVFAFAGLNILEKIIK